MRRTILLADDSLTIQRLVAGTFAEGEFDVVSVSNGEAAIRKFDEIHPSVVLADIYMPGKNGYEVCAHVRHHAAHSHTPVILLVGAFDAFDEAQAMETGATANITKPFEPRALIALVHSVLAHGESAQTPPPSPPVVEARRYEPAAPAVAPAPQLAAAEAVPVASADKSEDLLGLESLFKEPEVPTGIAAISDQDVDRIVDRVIQRLSTQVIESIAWEVVPDIAEKIVREEFRRTNDR